MIRAAIVGMGWGGKTLVESVQGDSKDIQFVAGVARTQTDELKQFAAAQKLTLYDSYEKALADPQVQAVVLATPHSLHTEQVIAAARAGKHVFCEKPFALTKADADAAVNATKKARVTLGLGYNRRFHPEMTKLRNQIRSGEMGTILHIEATMTFPNGLFLKPDAWRADADGRPRHRRHDRSVWTDQPGLLPELPSRRRRRCRRHDVHALPDERRHVGLSRHDDRDGTRIQLP